jgi:copper chaperone CopZ
MKKITLDIKGMHCKSCSMLVKEALMDTNGVKDADVQLIKEKATINYDEKIASEKQLIEAINKEGYKATLAK